jgi:hypothetical protein
MNDFERQKVATIAPEKEMLLGFLDYQRTANRRIYPLLGL